MLSRPDDDETADELIKKIADAKEEPIYEFEERIKNNAANLKQNLNECKKILDRDEAQPLDPEYIPPPPK